MLFIFSTPELIRHLWQLKTIVFLHQYTICSVPLFKNQRKSLTDSLLAMVSLLNAKCGIFTSPTSPLNSAPMISVLSPLSIVSWGLCVFSLNFLKFVCSKVLLAPRY